MKQSGIKSHKNSQMESHIILPENTILLGALVISTALKLLQYEPTF